MSKNTKIFDKRLKKLREGRAIAIKGNNSELIKKYDQAVSLTEASPRVLSKLILAGARRRESDDELIRKRKELHQKLKTQHKRIWIK